MIRCYSLKPGNGETKYKSLRLVLIQKKLCLLNMSMRKWSRNRNRRELLIIMMLIREMPQCMGFKQYHILSLLARMVTLFLLDIQVKFHILKKLSTEFHKANPLIPNKELMRKSYFENMDLTKLTRKKLMTFIKKWIGKEKF